VGRLLDEVVARKGTKTRVHLDQERHESRQDCCHETVRHFALRPGYDNDAVEERIGRGTEFAEREKSVDSDADDPKYGDVSAYLHNVRQVLY
jgi:hypothetical protein